MKSKVSIAGFVCCLVSFLIFAVPPCLASIKGTVTDTTGSPVSDELVTFTDETNPENIFSGYTNNDGKYEISLTPATVNETMPIGMRLYQNYPNPFNPSTTIPFSLNEAGFVNLSIYNITGQKVRTLVDNYHPVRSHTVTWNGLDNSGKSVAAGIYIYQIKFGDTVESRKMLLIDGGVHRAVVYRFAAISMVSIANITYRVTIYGSNIVVYQQGGITIEENEVLDFVVKLLPTGMTLAAIPGGTFQMGDEVGDLWDGCRPVHTVTVSSFEMSTTEITNAQYAEYLNEALASGDIEVKSGDVYGKTGDWSGERYLDIGYEYNSNNKFGIYYSNGTFTVTSGKENWPVVAVTWYGSKAFAIYYELDLPTEAEWEYAARGEKQYMYGTDDGTIDKSKANYDDWPNGYPVDVGSYPANPFGLYDMSGNVWEWCHDWYGNYSSDSAANPMSALTGSGRVFRGGGWSVIDYGCRAADRVYFRPYVRSYNIGFRVVRR